MPNKIIETEKGVALRINNAYTNNEKHFVEPYEDRYFGSFKFIIPVEAKATLKEAVKLMRKDGETQDTIFNGPYPKWIEDEYGTSLRVNGRVKFYKDIEAKEEVPANEIRNFIYALEIHLTKTKDGGIYLRVARAVVTGVSERYNDDLFKDETGKFNLTDDDLPF